MSYEKKLWKDYPDTSTPITADALNRIEDRLYELGFGSDGAVPERIVNLFDVNALINGTLTDSGNVFDHAANKTSDYIPVHPNTEYVIYSPTGYRLVFFDAARDALPSDITGLQPGNIIATYTTPADAAYARIGVTSGTPSPFDSVVFNRGRNLWSPDETIYSGWWEDRETPPVEDVPFESLNFTESDKIPEAYVSGAVPKRLWNMFDLEGSVLGNLGSSGAVNPHMSNRVTRFIPVEPSTQYISHSTELHKVVFYKEDETLATGTNTDWFSPNVEHHHITPEDAAYVRINIVSFGDPVTIFNKGDVLFQEGVVVSSGWWDDRELPPGVGSSDGIGGINEDSLVELVESLLPQYEPSFPTLEFETIDVGWSGTPKWLSLDGEVVYGNAGHLLFQSTDDWDTTTEIASIPHNIQAIRELGDGELLVSTSRNEDDNLRAKLFRSEGYDRDNPTNAVWSEVLEARVDQANFVNSWGLHVYQNIVIAGEYGLRGEQGARHIYLSEDYGRTFKVVFDQMTEEVEGRPEWTTTAHIHTAAWDPYWSRIWLVVGDNPNTATYYSDDKGDTWVYVEDSGGPPPAVQYTGIMPLPDVVLFGSDRHPNGLYGYRRGEKSDMPVIKPIILTDNEDRITKVFQMAFKRDWSPTTPTYFAATGAAGRAPTTIVGTVDGKKAQILWEGVHPDIGGEYSGSVSYALGPTAKGNIIAPMTVDPTVTGVRVMRAPAPTWSRV